MRIDNFRLVNLKSFADTGTVPVGSVNILLGPNNAGKSTVLRGLRFLQDQVLRGEDIRIGASGLEIKARVTGDGLSHVVGAVTQGADVTLSWSAGQAIAIESIRDSGGRSGHQGFPMTEPRNLYYTYLSKRKVTDYEQIVNLESTMRVGPDLRYLVSKIARVSNPASPSYERYVAACEATLGFRVSTFASPGGQRAGRVVDNFRSIALEDMGEGVASLVGLIVDLCVAEDKVFLIEEPENDLHPIALRALLDLVIEASVSNQFFISTHSNIVARHLGGLPDAHLFWIQQDSTDPMTPSTITDLGNDPRERKAVLVNLGYELYDFDLFEGWLFLEESSAERIIRDYLIPRFVPRLTRIRTISANGVSNIEPSFREFHRLFLFTHLEQIYHNRAVVLVDGDDVGLRTVEQMKLAFPDRDEWCFRSLNLTAFEGYYPTHFADEVAQVLAIEDRQARRASKRDLLDKVILWLDEDPDRAAEALAESANEVVEILLEIDDRLFNNWNGN